jgi:hypothetical protein
MKKIAIVCMLFCCSALNAAPYNNYLIKQTGFPGGGIVNGHFHANDLNGDGWISSDLGEVSSFSISYSGGGSIFFPIEFTENSFITIEYKIKGKPSWIGDDTDDSRSVLEGIYAYYSMDLFNEYYEYNAIDYGHGWNLGRLTYYHDSIGELISETENLAEVSSVPLPSSFYFFISGLIAIWRWNAAVGRIHP